MSNPYEPPSANLGSEIPVLKSKTLWKVFFWIIFLLEIAYIISLFHGYEESLTYVISELLIYAIIILGLFGFAYDRKIISKYFWAVMIPVGIAFDCYSFTTIQFEFESEEEIFLVFAIAFAIFFPFLFFQYLALYKYSFKSPEIWSGGLPAKP